MISFTNPRLNATFGDWPLGFNARGTCTFVVETHPKRGQRVLRTTTGKPKASTYSDKCCIVDGSDGKTYLLHYSKLYEAVSIYQSDNQHNAHFGRAGDHYVSRSAEPELFAELLTLIENAK